jgi:hypothetical protein
MAHLKVTARLGDKLVFLIRTAKSAWGHMETQLPMVETGNITSWEYRASAWRFNLEREKQRAECNLAAMYEALRRNGMNPELKMYAGGLSKAVLEWTKSGAARLVVLPANHPDIQVAKALLAPLILLSHRLPRIAFLPPWYTTTGVEQRCFF